MKVVQLAHDAQVGCQLKDTSRAVIIATPFNYNVQPVPHDIAIRDNQEYPLSLSQSFSRVFYLE